MKFTLRYIQHHRCSSRMSLTQCDHTPLINPERNTYSSRPSATKLSQS